MTDMGARGPGAGSISMSEGRRRIALLEGLSERRAQNRSANARPRLKCGTGATPADLKYARSLCGRATSFWCRWSYLRRV
jgi:hypothetical protein